jgi:uncharacterized membrane protein
MARTRTMKEQIEQRGEREGELTAQRPQPSGASPDRMAQGARLGTEIYGRQRSAVKGFNEEQLARGLGWFSICLGLAEVAAPRELARLIGVRGDHSGLFRLLGAREIASGVGILTQRRPVAGLWSRVGGDAIDLSLLGAALGSPRSNRGRLAATTAAVAGVTTLDMICLQQLGRPSKATVAGGAMRVEQAVTINHSPEELYRFWRNFQNLPRFMKHLESVQTVSQTASQTTSPTAGEAMEQSTANRRSHWVAKGPAGTRIEWDAEITEDRPNELIAWRSIEGAEVDNFGSVRFERAPGGRGTVVRVKMQYNPPAGVVGAAIAKLFGEDPQWQVKDDLRRFKQLMEAGEIITIEGQPAGRSSTTSWRYDRAARS